VCRRVAVRGFPLVRGIEAERPHPRRADRRGVHLENPPGSTMRFGGRVEHASVTVAGCHVGAIA
jgi:hypothetical protein